MRFTRQGSDWYCPKLIAWIPKCTRSEFHKFADTLGKKQKAYQKRTSKLEPNPDPKWGPLKEMLLGEGPNLEPFLVPILGTTEHTCVVVFLHEEASASLESLRIAKFQFVKTRTTTIDTTFTDNLQERWLQH